MLFSPDGVHRMLILSRCAKKPIFMTFCCFRLHPPIQHWYSYQFSESRMDALRNDKQRCDQLRVVYLNAFSMQEKDVSQLTLLVNIRCSNK